MNVLTFDDFLVKSNIEKRAMRNIDLLRIGEQISITPIEVIMRDEEMKTIKNIDHNLIVNIQPNEGIHWALVISRDRFGGLYYFDSYGC